MREPRLDDSYLIDRPTWDPADDAADFVDGEPDDVPTVWEQEHPEAAY